MIQEILHEAEALEYQECLPSKEAVMFLQGNKYQTGSDYSNDILGMSLEELTNK